MDETGTDAIGVQKSMFFAITVCECILAAALILSILGLKFFAPKTYKNIKKWYVQNVEVQTDVNEIVKGVKNET